MADPRCLPRIPWEKWAVDAGLENGEQDWENWRYLRVWAQQLLDGCISSVDDIEWSYAPLITTVELGAWFPRARMQTVKFRAIAYIIEGS